MLRTFLLPILVGVHISVHAQRGSTSLCQAASDRLTTPLASREADPILRLPVERPITLQLPRTQINEGRSAWHSAGIGALIGLGVGSVVGVVAANNHGSGMADPGPWVAYGYCAGGGTVLGGLIGLLAGSSSGGGGRPFPGY